jgi:hypothetical protein
MNENNNGIKKHSEGSVGPIIGTLIIVVLLIATALYVWGEHLNTAAQIKQENQNTSMTTTTIIYSTSTETTDIQSDLEANPIIKNPGF